MLIDVGRETVAWLYDVEGAVAARGMPDGRVWLFPAPPVHLPHKPSTSQLLAVSLPSESTRVLAQSVEFERQVIVAPGTAVKVSASVSVSGSSNDEAIAALTHTLQQNGAVVDAQAEVQFNLAAQERSTGETTTYKDFGFTRGERKEYTVRQKAINIEFSVREPATGLSWSSSSRVEPWASMTVRGDPQTEYDSKLREGYRRAVKSLKVPKYVFGDLEKIVAGRSRLTPNGEQPAGAEGR
jgi:hypothetical protein